MSEVPGVHVIPYRGKWRVRKSRSMRSIRTGLSYAEAVIIGYNAACASGAYLYMHDHTGRISERIECPVSGARGAHGGLRACHENNLYLCTVQNRYDWIKRSGGGN